MYTIILLMLYFDLYPFSGNHTILEDFAFAVLWLWKLKNHNAAAILHMEQLFSHSLISLRHVFYYPTVFKCWRLGRYCDKSRSFGWMWKFLAIEMQNQDINHPISKKINCLEWYMMGCWAHVRNQVRLKNFVQRKIFFSWTIQS